MSDEAKACERCGAAAHSNIECVACLRFVAARSDSRLIRHFLAKAEERDRAERQKLN